MAIVRQSWADIDQSKLIAELESHPPLSEAEIDRQAAEDGDAWTDEDFAKAVLVFPPPSAEQVRTIRSRLGLSQADFARKFGFSIDTVQQYEQGRRVPSGPATTLLRVIDAEPEAVVRALARAR